MPEAHWKLESIERGARIVVITPEYNPTAYRADYGFQSGRRRAALFRRPALILDENLQDIDYIKQFTDMPLLVRTDTLQYLDPRCDQGFQVPGFLEELLGPHSATRRTRLNAWAA